MDVQIKKKKVKVAKVKKESELVDVKKEPEDDEPRPGPTHAGEPLPGHVGDDLLDDANVTDFLMDWEPDQIFDIELD